MKKKPKDTEEESYDKEDSLLKKFVISFTNIKNYFLAVIQPGFNKNFLSKTTLFLLIIFAPIIIFLIYFFDKKRVASQFDLEKMKEIDIASVVYDRYGKEMTTISFLNRRRVRIEEIPFYFIQALISAEDSRFFEHNGVDYIGICRAMLRNLKDAGFSQGASTITQQLARNAYELKAKSINRKLIEAFLANRIEKKYTKSQILEYYLNQIYFGKGFYGVRTASLGYFGKNVRDLTLGESAILCGLIKSPNNLNPIDHPDGARKTRNLVLGRMLTENLITESQFNQVIKEPIVTNPRKKALGRNYVYDHIQKKAIEHLEHLESQEIGRGGYGIFTTLDIDLQKSAEKALQKSLIEFERNVENYEHETYQDYVDKFSFFVQKLKAQKIAEDEDTPDKPVPKYLQGSLLAIENKTGNILAFVGGRNFGHSQFNRVFHAKRKPGTSFTPFVYATAYENNIAFPGTILKDFPIDNRLIMVGGESGTLGEWGVERLDNQFERKITAHKALSLGKNSATVRLGLETGLEQVKELAQRAGIDTSKYKYSNTFLGENNLTLPDMCRAFTAFPNLGKQPKNLAIITKIIDKHGNIVYSSQRGNNFNQVLDDVTAYQIHTALQDSMKNGSASYAGEYGLKSFYAGVKTGTAYNFQDLMVVGYNSQITCGVWAGFDYPKTIHRGAFSNKVILPAWVDIMNASSEILKPQPIPPPASARQVEICKFSGEKATEKCYEKADSKDGAVFQRTSFITYVSKRYPIIKPCSFHNKVDSPEYENLNIVSSLLTNITTDNSIHLAEPTLLGFDPYSTRKQVLEKAEQKKRYFRNSNGQQSDFLEQGLLKNPIQLKAPKPINFD